jgi:hypothetical protein
VRANQMFVRLVRRVRIAADHSLLLAMTLLRPRIIPELGTHPLQQLGIELSHGLTSWSGTTENISLMQNKSKFLEITGSVTDILV